MGVLDSNCNEHLPAWTCTTGNISSTVSMVMWFVVLIPQVMQNYKRKSVQGLNVIWALANFTASLCNVFFVFSVEMPIQVRIMASYMVGLEILMLAQFAAFGTYDKQTKSLVIVTCCVVWSAIITTNLFVPGAIGIFAWVSVCLWSSNTFPQLYTNMNAPHVTAGQSTLSVIITSIGKSSDSLTAFLLQMPAQTRVLAYFSATTAWLNALHVLVLYITAAKYMAIGASDPLPTLPSPSPPPSPPISLTATTENPVTIVRQALSCSDQIEQRIRTRLETSLALRYVVGTTLYLLMLAVLCGMILTIWEWWTLSLPISVLVLILSFHVFISRKRNQTGDALLPSPPPTTYS